MKAIILAGGFGTRLSEETVLKPKPMVEQAGRGRVTTRRSRMMCSWRGGTVDALGISELVILTGPS